MRIRPQSALLPGEASSGAAWVLSIKADRHDKQERAEKLTLLLPCGRPCQSTFPSHRWITGGS